MLTALANAAQAVVALLIAYTLSTAVAGWRTQRPAPEGNRRWRFVVAIPAHDEEAVVGAVVGDMLANRYPRDLVEIWVVADRCTDRTVEVARAAGARVHQRNGGQGGKGAALAHFLGAVAIPAEAGLVIVDADNRVPPDLLGRFSDELDAGSEVIQAYLDSTRPAESWVSLATAMSYWASNRMVQLARCNLGWPVDLGGTGMCLTGSALEAVGGFGESLVEDQDLTARLTLAERSIQWIHDVRVRDEKPVAAGVAVRQRARWASGKRSAARRYTWRLLGAAWKRRSWGVADLAVRLVQPSRTVVAVASAGLALVAGLTASEYLWPWQVWGGIAAAQFFAPLPFLLRDRVPLRWVVRYPVLAVLAVLWLPVQIASRRVTGWYHTPHRG